MPKLSTASKYVGENSDADAGSSQPPYLQCLKNDKRRSLARQHFNGHGYPAASLYALAVFETENKIYCCVSF